MINLNVCDGEFHYQKICDKSNKVPFYKFIENKYKKTKTKNLVYFLLMNYMTIVCGVFVQSSFKSIRILKVLGIFYKLNLSFNFIFKISKFDLDFCKKYPGNMDSV